MLSWRVLHSAIALAVPMEYEVEKEDDGTLSLSPVYIEQNSSIVLTFVRGDGNRNNLLTFS